MGLLIALTMAFAAAAPSTTVDDGPWRITLAGEPTRIGTLTVSARNLKLSTGRTWVQHRLVFRNRGSKPVTVQDTRSSRFLEDERLLAGDDGCGYAIDNPGDPVIPNACQRNLDRFVVPPRGTERRNVYLWKGLPGMRRLVPGTYMFPRPIETKARSGVADLVYEVNRR